MKPEEDAHGQERGPAVIELLDGSWLGVFDADEVAARELETWALVPEGTSEEPARAGGVWTQAIEAGPLLYVAFSGIVGNAAWSVFPAAARFLSRRRHTALDVAGVTARVRATAEQAFGASAAEGVVIRDVRRDGDGTWVASFDLAGGETGAARLAPDGTVVRLARRPSSA